SRVESALAECVAGVLRRCADPRPHGRPLGPRGALRRVHAFLRDQYARQVTVGELEALGGMSRFHLIRSFTRAYGLPPHAPPPPPPSPPPPPARPAATRPAAPPPACNTRGGSAAHPPPPRHFKKVFGITPGEYARHVGARDTPRS